MSTKKVFIVSNKSESFAVKIALLAGSVLTKHGEVLLKNILKKKALQVAIIKRLVQTGYEGKTSLYWHNRLRQTIKNRTALIIKIHTRKVFN
jgi:hypothetical protein